jgi:NADPH-dependent 2,4-dienoyl-CoA reductase/sulfur reductase-like enzyme
VLPRPRAGNVQRGGKLVVVGAGWIGAEVAASVRQRGLETSRPRVFVASARSRSPCDGAVHP